MKQDLTLDVGQANELKLAFRRHGYNNEDIKRLTEGKVLADVLEVLKGFRAVSRISGPVINCDMDPRIPTGFENVRNLRVKSHRRHGELLWEPERLRTFFPLPEHEKSDYSSWKTSSGARILKMLGKKPVLNACLKDFLFAHPQMIPHEWLRPHGERLITMDQTLMFFGTIFIDEENREWVSGIEKKDGVLNEILMPMKDGYFSSYSMTILLGPWTRESH